MNPVGGESFRKFFCLFSALSPIRNFFELISLPIHVRKPPPPRIPPQKIYQFVIPPNGNTDINSELFFLEDRLPEGTQKPLCGPGSPSLQC